MTYGVAQFVTTSRGWRASIWRGALRPAVLVYLAAAVSGCGDDMIPLDLVGYNHTDRSIYAFAVDGQGGPYIDAHKVVRWPDGLGERPHGHQSRREALRAFHRAA